MGLDMSHDAWHGAYSAFARYRNTLAKLIGFPEYEDIQDINDERFKKIAKDPLIYLLAHSDCDGYITPAKCKKLADRLDELMPEIYKLGDGGGHIGLYRDKTAKLIKGLRLAHKKKQRLHFR